MAMLALRPATVEFVQTVLFSQDQELLVEQIDTGEDSPLVGSTISQIEERFPGVRILALKTKDGAVVINPNPQITVEKSSRLTAFGTVEQLQAVE